MGSVNEGRHYIITLFLIGWAYTQNDPYLFASDMMVKLSQRSPICPILFLFISSCYQLIKAELCVHASVNYAIIGSDNGLSSDRCQAIIWTCGGL